VANLAEESRDDRIFGKPGESLRVQHTEPVRPVAVFRTNLTTLDNQLGRKSSGVFPVDQNVRSNLSENLIPDAELVVPSR